MMTSLLLLQLNPNSAAPKLPSIRSGALQIPCTLNLASESRHHDPKFIKMAKDQFTFKQEDYGAGQLEAEIGSALKKHGIVGARLKIAELRQAMSMDETYQGHAIDLKRFDRKPDRQSRRYS
ncbi:hypothetical protein B0O80DRAFT_421025 [Mortierella sp. GBAus27b]|nr:hypothetical protein B0O80DRAFT_421025 [Mortierella sp. GBAus27b]